MNKGQALIVLLFIGAIVLLLAIEISILNLSSLDLAGEAFEGSILYNKTEGYLENAALRYLRNPNYSGESLQDGNISCTIKLTKGEENSELISSCQKNQRSKKAGITITYNQGVYNFSKVTERE